MGKQCQLPKSVRKLCEELGLFLVVATMVATDGFW